MLAQNIADSDDEQEAKSQVEISKSKTLRELGALVKKRKNDEVKPRIEAPDLIRQFE